MPIVLLAAAAAILGGVVLAALGRAGEMATFAGDTAPIEFDEVSATDVALLRPPMSLWGYNAQATEDALRVIARSVTARDVEIATLRRELAELQARQDGVRAAGTGDRAPGPAVPPADQPRRADQPSPPSPPNQSSHAGLPGQPGPQAQPGPPSSHSQPAQPSYAGLPGQPRHPGPSSHAGPSSPSGHADPPGLADPAGLADLPELAERLPAWLRPSEPGTDE